MSEAAGGSVGGATASSATPGTTAAEAPSQSQGMFSGGSSRETSTRESSGREGAPKGATEAKGQSEEGGDDEFEEIALGSVKGKVPKSLAKAIKDFERGAQSKMSEAAKARKEAQQREQLLDLLEQDPDAFAEHYEKIKGKKFDVDSFAEMRLAKKYELMSMSPEQRELMEAKQQLEKFQSAERQSKQGVIDEITQLLGADAPKGLENYPKEELHRYLEHQRQVFQEQENSLQQEVIEAWKDSGLPKHPYFGALMSFQMMSHQKSTNEPLPAKEAAARVKAGFAKAVREIVSAMDPSGIQELLGQDTLSKLRQHDIDRVTAKAASQVGQTQRPGQAPASDSTSKKYVNQTEWRRAMGLE